MHIEFSNGSHFECFYPPTEISGIIYGDRKFRCYNKGYILERKHKILTEYSIQNQKKGLYQTDAKLKVGEIIGGVFGVTSEFIDALDKHYLQNKHLRKFNGLKK